jgi:hypothetical protein
VAREALSPTPMNCFDMVSLVFSKRIPSLKTYSSLLVNEAVCFG